MPASEWARQSTETWWRCRSAPKCAPWWSARPTIGPSTASRPGDLEEHRCVNYRLPGGSGLLPWEIEGGGREIRFRPSGQVIVNDELLAAAAVRTCAGLGYMLEGDVATKSPTDD